MNGIQIEFDNKASNYESNRLSGWYIAHAEILLGLIPKQSCGVIIDIGCGTGYFLRRYLNINTTMKGIGIDVSPKMIQEANKLASNDNVDNVEFYSFDWETFDPDKLGVTDANIVICANTYHYFSDPLDSLTSIAKIMSGGTLYIVERDKSTSLLTSLWDIAHRYFIKDNVIFYNRNTIIDTLKDAGFNNIEVLTNVKKYLWKNKLFTNLVIIRAGFGCTKQPLIDNLSKRLNPC